MEAMVEAFHGLAAAFREASGFTLVILAGPANQWIGGGAAILAFIVGFERIKRSLYDRLGYPRINDGAGTVALRGALGLGLPAALAFCAYAGVVSFHWHAQELRRASAPPAQRFSRPQTAPAPRFVRPDRDPAQRYMRPEKDSPPPADLRLRFD